MSKKQPTLTREQAMEIMDGGSIFQTLHSLEEVELLAQYNPSLLAAYRALAAVAGVEITLDAGDEKEGA